MSMWQLIFRQEFPSAVTLQAVGVSSFGSFASKMRVFAVVTAYLVLLIAGKAENGDCLVEDATTDAAAYMLEHKAAKVEKQESIWSQNSYLIITREVEDKSNKWRSDLLQLGPSMNPCKFSRWLFDDVV